MLEFWQQPFLRTGLAVGLISALLCALTGFFVILKRVVFIGIAISQAAGLGVALGFITGVSPYVTALALSVITSLFFWLYNTEHDIPRDTVVALIYLLSAGFTTLLIAKNPRVHTHGADIVSGNLLYTTTGDLVISVGSGIIAALVFLYFYKALVFLSYDRETALTAGIEGNSLDFVFYLMLGMIVSISIRAAGLLFVFASLIIPPMTAFKLFTSAKSIIAGSLAIAGISVICGFWLSYNMDMPTSPLVICIYGIFFAAAIIIGRIRRR